jgi:predicted DNA-binding mobile mystery protein A
MDKQQIRRRLDRRLAAWQELPAASFTRPHAGWVRAIRDALGMSAADLAARLGVSQIAVTKLEASERAGRVRLDTLERAAHALDCELVYALVPRTSLDATARAQAERVIARDFGAVANSMRLEDQGLSDDDERDARLGLVERILDERGLWRADA